MYSDSGRNSDLPYLEGTFLITFGRLWKAIIEIRTASRHRQPASDTGNTEGKFLFVLSWKTLRRWVDLAKGMPIHIPGSSVSFMKHTEADCSRVRHCCNI